MKVVCARCYGVKPGSYKIRDYLAPLAERMMPDKGFEALFLPEEQGSCLNLRLLSLN